MSRLLFLAFLCTHLAVLGCDSNKQQPGSFDQDALQRQAADWLDQIVRNKDMPLDELKKLHQFEYRTVSLPMDSSAEEIEAKLNELGIERWDCFHAERQIIPGPNGRRDVSLLILCKRGSETALRYIPRSFLGR